MVDVDMIDVIDVFVFVVFVIKKKGIVVDGEGKDGKKCFEVKKVGRICF